MNVFQLECFLAVAESLNFTQAASALYITQPSLSRTISGLEDEMGVKLLVRNTRSTKLTPAGIEFARECPGILNALRDGIAKAVDAASGRRGTISLGFQRDTFEPFTVEIARQFGRQHPEVALRLRPMGISEMLEELSRSTLDAAVTAGHTTLKNEKKLLLKSRGERVVMSPSHPLADRESVRMEELKNEDFVVMSHSASSYGYDSVIDKAFAAGFTPKIVARVDYVPGVLMLVACGKGISLLNDGLSVDSHDMVRFVPLVCDNTFDRYLMWDGDSPNPCLPLLIDTAMDWLKSG